MLDLSELTKLDTPQAKKLVHDAIRDLAGKLENSEELADEANLLLHNEAFIEAVRRLGQSTIDGFLSAGVDPALGARARALSLMLRAMIVELHVMMRAPEDHAAQLAQLQLEYERLDKLI